MYASDANRITARQLGTGAVKNYTSDANGNTLTDATHANKGIAGGAGAAIGG